ncbi:MAG: AtpZ/AtpI family protein [Thiothrix sp.]|uniref:AtpZ/AtpI family protein n=1 Tax=Thiothrix sp. TaxID=1032 RepID=UPI00260E1323|nr:AtpZ/AtpI family protein [Thiothrix sp.]MDD5393880.1 AtpZ/AtpI family protein [Thiothrix sp.]
MKPADDDTDFLRKVSAKATRKLKAQREGKPRVWMNLGMLGIVGWSVVIPVLIGLVGGWWLDQCCPGKYIWSLNLLMVGLFLGCVNVCHWLRKEYRAMRDDKEQKHD